MKKKTNSLLTLLLVGMIPVGAPAQNKVVFAPKVAQSVQTAADMQQRVQVKAETKANEPAVASADDFKSPVPLYPESDRQMAVDYAAETGQQPILTPQATSPIPRRASEEQRVWQYTGFNAGAGTKEDGTETGGFVNFSLLPFACDTVSSDNGTSPYSYMAKGKLYCFLPFYDQSTGLWSSITRTTYDANTLERLDQKTFKLPGGKERVPYIMTYDAARDVVYAISIGDKPAEDREANAGYYLNILDTATCQLQRVGYLGSYSNNKSKGNFAPKGLVVTETGKMYVQVADDALYIEEINPMTCERKLVGRTEMPTRYVFGLQPMLYDVNSGKLIVNHYDFSNGTQYYKVSLRAKDDNILTTELMENLPTGYTYFFKRPESEVSSTNLQLADLQDIQCTVDENGKATISFTIPDTDNNGEKINVPTGYSDIARAYVYVDNQYTAATGFDMQSKLGSKQTATFDVAQGMHIVTIQIAPMYSDLRGIKNSIIVFSGYDAPALVSRPTLSIKDNKAVITWGAPTKGLYDDFGSKFDATDITYKVVRDLDGKVIADGISELRAEDNSLSDEIHTYTYTVYATSHGMSNTGLKTNAVSAGKYMAMPYENNCDNSGCLDGYTILNLDNNGSARTWQWNYIYSYITTGLGSALDWLITPKFHLTSDNVYAFRYVVKGNGSLRTTVGNDNTPEAQNVNVLDDVDGYTTDSFETREFYFRPGEEDYYHFGLYNYSIGENAAWSVNHISIKPVAKASAPGVVRDVQVNCDADGALGTTLSFNIPDKAINGSALTSVSKVVVYDLQGNVLGTTDNVTPGASASIKVEAVHGWNDFKIVAVGANGEGWPVVVRKFVGLDKPKAVSNFKLSWGEEQTVVNLSWDAPTEGMNGGYVNPSAYTYKIYKYDKSQYPSYIELGSTDNETSVEVNILDASENQNQYVFGVTAVNTEGESDYARSGIVLGTPYSLPFDEPFSVKGIYHSPWIVAKGKNDQSWLTDEGRFNAKIQPQNNDGLQLALINTGKEDGSSLFLTPIVDFTTAKSPVFSVWIHHSDAMPEDAYVSVLASTDGSKNYQEVAPKQTLTGNNGWTQHLFDLSALKGKKAQVALNAYLPNPSFRIFADNWSIHEAAGNDLALTAISKPYMPKVGEQADIAVTVTNMGKETATNYSVLFNLNGEIIADKEADKPLALGETATFHFPLAISAAQKEIVYSAEVSYADDENEDNNLSTEVELTPQQLDLPAPGSLALGSDNALSWFAPETMDGREVLLDFEDVPTFQADNIDGWTTADLDGCLTTGFVQYYNNYWPYFQQPLAWMVWNTDEAGASTASMWKAYDGEKCLITWGNYGADANGRINTDPVDDWFISPEIKGGTELSFYTLANDVSNTLEIRTSATDRRPESFTNVVKTVSYSSTATWSEVKATLPADAKYIAIRSNCNNFGTMIDNIRYTEAKTPQLKGYNVYLGSYLAETVTGTSSKATSNGTYAVSAVYDLGESALSNEVNVTTSISEVGSSTTTVSGGKGVINVNAAGGNNIAVYGTTGQQVASVAAGNETAISVAPGIYIVKVGTQTFKVSVK